ncbi:FG-nucleoporin nsp1 [Coemansia sp. RSA 1722]|nr:FG-nucleoporin nsp1 [Coemansia sp. RSA 1722]
MFGGGNSNPGQPGGGFSFGAGTGSGTGAGAGAGSVFGSAAATNDKPQTSFSGFGGFGAAASAAPSGTSVFGAATAATTAASSDPAKPATPAFGFGNSTTNSTGGSLFGATSSATAAAATPKAEAAKPAFSFGSNTAGSSGSLFGAAPASAAASTSTPAASAGGSLFGASSKPLSGFSIGASAAATAATTAAATTTTAASTGGLFSFGGASSAAKSDAPASATTTAANPTAGTGLGGFKLSTTPVASGASAADSKKTGAETKPAAAAATSAKIENSTDLANAALRGKTLEEIAQMWTSELAAQTRAFHTQANTVSYWDRALVQQGKRITELYDATMAVEAEQAALDQSLEHMEGQQSALQNLLDTYEGHVQDIVSKTKSRSSGSKGVAMTADEERDHVYSSAERLNTQLDELTRRLTALVEDVNGISSANTGEADGQRGNPDPFAQIVQILNAHLSSLEWIDSQTANLQDRVKCAQRVHQDVSSAQSSLSGAYGASEPSSSNAYCSIGSAASRHNEPASVMPGGFSSDPAPPVISSFGLPAAAAARKQQGFSAFGFGFGSSNPSAPRRGF